MDYIHMYSHQQSKVSNLGFHVSCCSPALLFERERDIYHVRIYLFKTYEVDDGIYLYLDDARNAYVMSVIYFRVSFHLTSSALLEHIA